MDVRIPSTFDQTTSAVSHVQPEDFRAISNVMIGSQCHVTQPELSHNAIDSSQSSNMSPLDPCNVFFTGYLDCAHEALRYLLEVERLPQDHPMVLGLQYQLYEHYRLLYVQHMFASNINVSGENVNYPLSQQQCARDDTCFPNNSVSDSSVLIQFGSYVQKGTCEADGMNNHVSSENTGKTIHIPLDTKPTNSQNTENQSEQTLNEQGSIADAGLSSEAILQNSGLSEDAQHVAMTLAEEIFTFMNADSDGSDDDEYDDDDDIDEGFEEMTEV